MAAHLYLDIDGVLSPHPRAAPTSWPDFRDETILLTYSPQMIRALTRVLIEHAVNPFWLTTWEDTAEWVGSKTGLTRQGEWPWLPALGFDEHGDWQKFATIRRHVAETGPDRVVWVDDQLAECREAVEWATEAGVLAIAPDPKQGITPGHVKLMREYLADREPEEGPGLAAA